MTKVLASRADPSSVCCSGFDADDVGEAAMTALHAARRAGVAHGVGPDLYDVTVIPKEAVVRPDDPGYPAMPD